MIEGDFMKNNVFTPYRVCPLGAHVDHQHGLVTGFAIDRGVSLDFDVTDDGRVSIISKNFPGKVEFNINDDIYDAWHLASFHRT